MGRIHVFGYVKKKKIPMCFEQFGGLFGTIFDHLWCSDGRLKKIDFLKKMQFFDFLGFLNLVVLDTKKHPKSQIFEKFSSMHCLYLEDTYKYIRWHPRDLQASSKHKQCIFEKFSKFWDFLCLFVSKTTKLKIPKNRKNCIFFKKSNFFKRPSGHHRRSEMVPNTPQSVQNIFLINTQCLHPF